MHELGVTFHVIKAVEEVARENNLTQVSNVILELGEVSMVIPDQLRDCFKWAVENRSEHMHGCELTIETIPAVTFCEDCREEYPTVEHGKICPFCHSEHTYLLKGNEFNIKQIEGC